MERQLLQFTMLMLTGADPGFLKGGGGSILGLQAEKGGSKRGSNFGPNVKKPTSWPKRGGPNPVDPPRIRYWMLLMLTETDVDVLMNNRLTRGNGLAYHGVCPTFSVTLLLTSDAGGI